VDAFVDLALGLQISSAEAESEKWEGVAPVKLRTVMGQKTGVRIAWDGVAEISPVLEGFPEKRFPCFWAGCLTPEALPKATSAEVEPAECLAGHANSGAFDVRRFLCSFVLSGGSR
jgi:hypothetical protein